MKKASFILIASLVFVLTGCGIHNGMIHNSAALGNANFDYVTKSVTGSAKVIYILGIGGLGKKSIVEKAKEKMLKDTPLKANQALVNLSVERRTSYFLLWWTDRYTVTADIVEFK